MINKCVICKSEAPFNLSYCYDCVNFKVVKCAMCDLVVPRDHAHYIEWVENYYCKKCFKKYC